MFIDSHAHLEGKRYDADRDAVLARAKQNGIEAYLAIGNGDGPETANCGFRLAEKYKGKPEYPKIWASVGIHPHEASLANAAAYAKLEQWARHPRVIAWGEIGLDYWYEHSPRDVQQRVFIEQMEFYVDVRFDSAAPAGEAMAMRKRIEEILSCRGRTFRAVSRRSLFSRGSLP